MLKIPRNVSGKILVTGLNDSSSVLNDSSSGLLQASDPGSKLTNF